VLEYVPAPQGVHMDAPDVEYVPAIHDKHVATLVALTSTEYVPAIHGVHVDAPVVLEYVPVIHGVHAAVPVVFLYVPIKHALHTTPSEAAENPVRHMQLFSAMLPLTAIVLAGQVIHV
jgi:hypothetical protein